MWSHTASSGVKGHVEISSLRARCSSARGWITQKENTTFQELSSDTLYGKAHVDTNNIPTHSQYCILNLCRHRLCVARLLGLSFKPMHINPMFQQPRLLWERFPDHSGTRLQELGHGTISLVAQWCWTIRFQSVFQFTPHALDRLEI